MGQIGGFAALNPLLEALQGSESSVRQVVAKALGQIGNQEAVTALLPALQDSDWSVREAAAEALGTTGSSQAIEPLFALFTATPDHYKPGSAFITMSEKLRQICAQALGRIGGPQAVEPLTSLLAENDPYIRDIAVRSLAMIRDPRTAASLIVALRDKSPEIRYVAAWGLGQIGDPQAAEPLLFLLRQDTSLKIRLTCYSALEGLPDSQIPESDRQKLVEAVATEIRRLYSRTRTVTTNYSRPGDWEEWDVETSTGGTRRKRSFRVHSYSRQESDPDTGSIHSLILLLPEEIREPVYALSGEAKRLFER